MIHGKFDELPRQLDEERFGRIGGVIRERKWLVFVVLPTLILAAYYWLVAADQFESEAHFAVRGVQGAPTAPAGLGAALSLFGGGGVSASDASSVSDYLSSHDAVDALRQHADLVQIFRRPEADFFSRLTPANPTPERLLQFYRSHVTIKLDNDSGLTTIKVRTFRPEDSFRLVNDLLTLGEARVNVLNRRAYDSSLKLARQQLADAERAVSQSQSALTAFRQGKRTIDPVAIGQAQIGVVSQLQAVLANARAQRNAMAGAISSSSPQMRAISARIAALESQLAAESARLAGNGDAIASNVGDYQGLQLRQQFASKRYDDAAAGLEAARVQAIRQQLFVTRIVEPNLPGKALYPKSVRIVGTVFVVLALIYGLGWLIVAGVREHAA